MSSPLLCSPVATDNFAQVAGPSAHELLTGVELFAAEDAEASDRVYGLELSEGTGTTQDDMERIEFKDVFETFENSATKPKQAPKEEHDNQADQDGTQTLQEGTGIDNVGSTKGKPSKKARA